MGNDLQVDIREPVTGRRILVIVEAGVPISATRNAPAASWPGLLTLGAAHCRGPLSRPSAILPHT
jgi:hypothetical protein